MYAQQHPREGNRGCALPNADQDGDGLVGVLEGFPSCGPIVPSLTTAGDTAPAAGVSLEIMPVADERGRIDDRRAITLPVDASTDLEDDRIVQHGIDGNGNGTHDFSAGTSDIAPGVPFETTARGQLRHDRARRRCT